MINPGPLKRDVVELIGQPQVHRLLLVDDDPAYSRLCVRYLRRVENCVYKVSLASSASEAIDICAQSSFDCVLMDYELPDSTGTEALQSLHDLLGSNLPPTIIMTAGDSEAAAISAVRSGAVDFLSKRNVSTAVLMRTIGNAVETGRLKRSIQIRGQQLKAANDELMRRNEEIQNFYHTVSHEIKTPLAATREFVAILSDQLIGPVNPQQQELLSHATECCDQITAQFNDLLDLTRLETGKLRLEKCAQPLKALIDRCVIAGRIVADSKNITIETSLPRDLPEFNFDRFRITQVLSNLLNNAIKFTPNGGVVSIVCAWNSTSDELNIRVIDTGCGIAKKHIERVFDRLYQIESEVETEHSGLGLGLAIATKIVSQHGGCLHVESEEGNGSTFVLSLTDVTNFP